MLGLRRGSRTEAGIVSARSVKLLFDQNLSQRLVRALQDLYPGSVHVRDVDLARADDARVWAFAKQHGFMIVSKDSDFHQLAFLHGPPPKVVWLRLGNCTTADILALRSRQEDVQLFDAHPDEAFLVLGP
jgi:predicted nuclease of predicted toxin-antitoxin system